MLDAQGIHGAKPFSVGFRIEHPQSLIDRARLGNTQVITRRALPGYKLVHHARMAARSPQLLHVSGWNGGGGNIRAKPRWRPTHEPVLAQ